MLVSATVVLNAFPIACASFRAVSLSKEAFNFAIASAKTLADEFFVRFNPSCILLISVARVSYLLLSIPAPHIIFDNVVSSFFSAKSPEKI